ncbi:hypothetical protein NPIL_499821 [Nephila pilipes]|uniref:Uncharacterized protein n=1 Tax=Nephila pilipes TaxID=299642 RepID=A0A8X6P0Z0_NEPPI|nr:hypothetical protein NPIL_499821 [Nephila pilipes]
MDLNLRSEGTIKCSDKMDIRDQMISLSVRKEKKKIARCQEHSIVRRAQEKIQQRQFEMPKIEYLEESAEEVNSASV